MPTYTPPIPTDYVDDNPSGRPLDAAGFNLLGGRVNDIASNITNVNNTADANKNVASAAKLTTARTIDGVSFDGSKNITIPKYGTCTTAAGTNAKSASMTDFALYTGAIVGIKFTNESASDSPTLNVNGTGAKPIFYGDAYITPGMISAGMTALFQYNGAQWVLLNPARTVGASGIETGSYVGTGLAGESNPNSLTFSIEPKIVYIFRDSYVASSGGTMYTGYFSNTNLVFYYGGTSFNVFAYYAGQNIYEFSGNTLTWYTTARDNSNSTSPGSQANALDTTYHYIAIG